MAARPGKLPASVLPLIFLTGAAALWLFFFEGDDELSGQRDAAGRLLTFGPDQVVELELTWREAFLRLSLEADRWRLTGRNSVGVWEDQVDIRAVEQLLSFMSASSGSAVMPDTNLSLDRLGLTSDQALQVTAIATDSTRVAFGVGIRNPVTGRYYVTGAGRSGVFSIGTDLVEQLRSLPGAVRAKQLWPGFRRAAAETLVIDQPAARDPILLVRDTWDQWWANWPIDRPPRLSRLVREYAEQYPDRQFEQGGMVARRADERAVNHALYLLEETFISEFGPLPATSEQLREAGLVPATVKVEVTTPAAPTTWRAAFGNPLDDEQVVASRDGQPFLLVVKGEARAALMAPLSTWLEMDLFAFAWTGVDSFALVQGETGHLMAVRKPAGWRARLPVGVELADPEVASHASSDLAHHLSRLNILGVRPPRTAGEPHPLADDGKTQLTVWVNEATGVRRVQVELGKTSLDGQAAAYFPASGKIVLVPPEILVTFRALFRVLQVPDPD